MFCEFGAYPVFGKVGTGATGVGAGVRAIGASTAGAMSSFVIVHVTLSPAESMIPPLALQAPPKLCVYKAFVSSLTLYVPAESV